MKSKTAVIAALAALAVPVAAEAAKPAEPGKRGRDNAAAKKQANTSKPKGVAFTLKGVGVTGALPVTAGDLTGPVTLDPTSANKHARRLLDLTKAEIEGTDTVGVGESGDGVVVKYVGLESTDPLVATDTVKFVGKVKRTGRGADATYSDLNIRKIVVIREDTV